MNILIIKLGALGDVVRTSYFAKALYQKYGDALRLSWLTSDSAIPLLIGNPHINRVVTDHKNILSDNFDCIFSLDDERETLLKLNEINTKRIIGAFLDPNTGIVGYTDDSSVWFDMGLISKFDKKIADELKKSNTFSHAEIFSSIFSTNFPEPTFYYPDGYLPRSNDLSPLNFRIGINPFAGDRWPSKELPIKELKQLINYLLNLAAANEDKIQILLFGAAQDRLKNIELVSELNNPLLQVVNTDSSVLDLAYQISTLNYLITTDSLAMHLAIAQKVRFLAFFAPTSAVEIDDFGRGRKLKSMSADYCSYGKSVDNSSITFSRLKNLFEAEDFMKSFKKP